MPHCGSYLRNVTPELFTRLALSRLTINETPPVGSVVLGLVLHHWDEHYVQTNIRKTARIRIELQELASRDNTHMLRKVAKYIKTEVLRLHVDVSLPSRLPNSDKRQSRSNAS